MIREIIVMNRFHADLMVKGLEKPPSDRWWLISIYGWPDKPLLNSFTEPMAEKAGCMGHITLNFGDITPEKLKTAQKLYPENAKSMILFGKNHARQIIDFTDKIHASKDEGDLIVHCHAGISRSGAVAMFVHHRTGIDFYDSEINPNKHITKVLEETAGIGYTEQARIKKKEILWKNTSK